MNAKESLYRQCAAALERLIDRYPEAVFTEIDVETEAADPKSWKTEDYQNALHDANAICGTQYRHRKLCRFGPVITADGSPDYARIAGRIVYADATMGPTHWETPNGRIPRLMVQDDEIGRQGRRAGTNRDDAEPWEDQPITVRPKRIPKRKASNGSVSKTDLIKQVATLKKKVIALEEEKALA